MTVRDSYMVKAPKTIVKPGLIQYTIMSNVVLVNGKLDRRKTAVIVDPVKVKQAVASGNYILLTEDDGTVHVVRSTLKKWNMAVDLHVRISYFASVRKTDIFSLRRERSGMYTVTMTDGRKFQTGIKFLNRIRHLAKFDGVATRGLIKCDLP